MFLGYKMSREMPNQKFFTRQNALPLQDAIEIIKKRYVDSLNMDTLQDNAMREIMAELDPHSVYMPPAELKQSAEDLSGNLQGIGVEFNMLRDTFNITWVVKDGPSEKAGLQIGDQILKVNDSTIAGKKMNATKIAGFIRGESGSAVNLTIKRFDKIFPVTAIRGNIARPSVVASYMIDKNTGFIKLFDKFTSTSYREFAMALDSLKQKGMTALIFDLRGNGGGFMDQAIDIVDEFLDDDKLIVYTQGVNSPRKEYRCKRPGLFEKGKLTILVDELSASASEIVCGAIQDWDRGTIIGRRPFGKGLVQETFVLNDGSALRLTVARYYTPLGRSIQRSYSGGRKMYIDEVFNRFNNGEAYYADSIKINNGEKYTTKAGKILYGGGGIMPDVFVGLDTSKTTSAINKLYLNNSFYDFVFHYFLDNRTLLDAYATPQAFEQNFDPSKQMWPKFVQWATRDTVNVTLLSAKEKQRIQDRMEANLARYKWRDNGFYQILNIKDPVVQKALEILRK